MNIIKKMLVFLAMMTVGSVLFARSSSALVCEPGFKEIFVKQSSLIQTPMTTHHFVITGVMNIVPPQTLTVLALEDQQIYTANYHNTSGNMAHYYVIFPSAMIVGDAWTCIDESWNGQFVESESTAVRLASYTGQRWCADRAYLRWETLSEINNLGFNLYRAATVNGPWLKINKYLIPSQNPGSPIGAVYSYIDNRIPKGGLYYLLEDIDIYGFSSTHGPVYVSPMAFVCPR